MSREKLILPSEICFKFIAINVPNIVCINNSGKNEWTYTSDDVKSKDRRENDFTTTLHYLQIYK